MTLGLSSYERGLLYLLSVAVLVTGANVCFSVWYLSDCRFRVDVTQIGTLAILNTLLVSILVVMAIKRRAGYSHLPFYAEFRLFGGTSEYFTKVGAALLHLMTPMPLLQLCFLVQMQFEQDHYCLSQIGVFLYNLYCLLGGLGVAVSFAVLYFETAQTLVKWLRPAERKRRIIMAELKRNLSSLQRHRRTPLGWLKFVTQFRINLFKLPAEDRPQFAPIVLAYYLDELCWPGDSIQAQIIRSIEPLCCICEEAFSQSDKIVLIIPGPTAASNESIEGSHRSCFLSNKVKWAESLATTECLLANPDHRQKARLRELAAADEFSVTGMQEKGRLDIFADLVEEWAIRVGLNNAKDRLDTSEDNERIGQPQGELEEEWQVPRQPTGRPWLVLEEVDQLNLDLL